MSTYKFVYYTYEAIEVIYKAKMAAYYRTKQTSTYANHYLGMMLLSHNLLILLFYLTINQSVLTYIV